MMFRFFASAMNISMRVQNDPVIAFRSYLLPDSAQEKPQRGKVVSVGNGRLLDDGSRSKMQLKKGNKVLFSSYAGSEIKIGDKEYLIMDESDVMAIIAD